MPENFWERAVVIGAFALAASFMLLLAKREFLDSGGPSQAASASAPIATPAGATFSNVAGAERSAAAEPARVTEPRRERVVAPTPARIDRQDCAALRDVYNPTRNERIWYLDNCMFLGRKARLAKQAESVTAGVQAQLQAAGFSLEQPATRRQSDAGATPPSGLTSSVAVQKAVAWIPDNTPVAVTFSTGDCTPIWLNGHWVVTCNVGIDGCTVAPCEAVLSVCVFAEEPMLVPDLLC